jgi:hypothetical protein
MKKNTSAVVDKSPAWHKVPSVVFFVSELSFFIVASATVENPFDACAVPPTSEGVEMEPKRNE